MAKTPTPAATSGFAFDLDLPVPALTRRVGSTSDTAEKLKAMPVGASFLEAVTVPETIKDADEREKAFKEAARTVSNRLSGAVRRFKKAEPSYEFVMRTVNDDKMGHGVRVWRVAVSEQPAASAQEAATSAST